MYHEEIEVLVTAVIILFSKYPIFAYFADPRLFFKPYQVEYDIIRGASSKLPQSYSLSSAVATTNKSAVTIVVTKSVMKMKAKSGGSL